MGKSPFMDMGNEFFKSVKAETNASEQMTLVKARAGLVKKKVQVKGKNMAYRWTKPGEGAKPAAKPGKEKTGWEPGSVITPKKEWLDDGEPEGTEYVVLEDNGDRVLVELKGRGGLETGAQTYRKDQMRPAEVKTGKRE